MMRENLVEMFANVIRNHWNRPAVGDYLGGVSTYGQLGQKILTLHKLFDECGIRRGDKIGLMGRNSASWATVYLGVITHGSVIVPILVDFSAGDVQHILSHAECAVLFIDESLSDKVDFSSLAHLQAVITLKDFKVLHHRKKIWATAIRKQAPSTMPHRFSLPRVDNNLLASIVYTSGTTGFSKGVMLSHNSLCANVVFGQNELRLDPGEKMLSFMPLAHAYACSFEFLLPLSSGCEVTFLEKMPSPKILISAFQSVRPHLILSVPLIFEKIYKKQLQPIIDKWWFRTIEKIPVARDLVYSRIRRKLDDTMGGRFREVVIGGAALNKEVEAFLIKIGFRFTVGYGMTEFGPLISYREWRYHRPESVGTPMTYCKIRIDSPDPHNIVGEILVRGENIMQGYYKNEAVTRETIDEDGWLHTGDLGVMDSDGYVFIRGRCKSMILGPSGQNIYPEEIESKLNCLPLITESLVIEARDKLIALVYIDPETLDKRKLNQQTAPAELETLRRQVNRELPGFSQISQIRLYPEEFQKTPTRKIKRYLYQLDRER